MILLNPFAPHITEEIWEQCAFGGMMTDQKWPTYDPDKCKEDVIEIVFQVKGRIRSRAQVAADITAEEAIALAKADPKVLEEIEGKTMVKEIYVPGKLVNLVVK